MVYLRVGRGLNEVDRGIEFHEAGLNGVVSRKKNIGGGALA
jgi:hypothetical protein